MWVTKIGTPVPPTDGKHGQLCNDDGRTDSSGDFLGGLNTEPNVTVAITDDNDGLEPGALTSTSLLLDRLDLDSPGSTSRKPMLQYPPLFISHIQSLPS